jgi:hypothetical protein
MPVLGVSESIIANFWKFAIMLAIRVSGPWGGWGWPLSVSDGPPGGTGALRRPVTCGAAYFRGSGSHFPCLSCSYFLRRNSR